eukprot:gene1592-32980_t
MHALLVKALHRDSEVDKTVPVGSLRSPTVPYGSNFQRGRVAPPMAYLGQPSMPTCHDLTRMTRSPIRNTNKISIVLLSRVSPFTMQSLRISRASCRARIGRNTRPCTSKFTVHASTEANKYATTKWWDAATTAVVTGANKGIGYQVALELARQGVTTIVTARDEKLGEKARDEIEATCEAEGINVAVFFQPLDITDAESVNNAGFAYKGDVFGADEAETTLKTNYYGTALACNGLLSVLREDSRIVNISSSRVGNSTSVVPNAELRQTWFDVEKESEIDALCEKFVADIRAGNHLEEGWSNSMYGTSKLACSMFTRLLAKVMGDSTVMINACCPGYCATDMSSMKGPKTALEGADTAVWLALRPADEFVTGKMWAEREDIPW